jgi:uncharacterized protein (DUF2126 family)
MRRDSATGRLGLLEFRAFEMPPHARMSLLQTLLLRALVARFWTRPYRERWCTGARAARRVHAAALRGAGHARRDRGPERRGYAFRFEWFAPFLEFRFPRYGTVSYEGIEIELRQAIEPWHVLGRAAAQTGTSRFVDSSVERLQVKGHAPQRARHAIACNGASCR